MVEFYQKWQKREYNPEIIRHLNQMGDLFAKEVKKAARILNKRFGEYSNNIYGCPEIDDLIQDALGAIMCGQRNWKYKKVKLSTMIVGVVRSWLKDIYRISMIRARTELEFIEKPPKRNGVYYNFQGNLLYPEKNNRTTISDEAIRKIILKVAEDDILLCEYIKIKLSDVNIKAENIAKRLKITTREVYALNKKLKYRKPKIEKFISIKNIDEAE